MVLDFPQVGTDGHERRVLAENLRLFRKKAAIANEDLKARLAVMVRAAERELALFDAADAGVRGPWNTVDEDVLAEAGAVAAFARDYGTDGRVAALIDPRPGLAIAALNSAFEQASGRSRASILDRSLFVLFPDNPNDPDATGVANLYASFRRVAETGREE